MLGPGMYAAVMRLKEIDPAVRKALIEQLQGIRDTIDGVIFSLEDPTATVAVAYDRLCLINRGVDHAAVAIASLDPERHR